MSFLKNSLKAVIGVFSFGDRVINTPQHAQDRDQAVSKRSAADAFNSTEPESFERPGKRPKIENGKTSPTEVISNHIQNQSCPPIQPDPDRTLMPPPAKHYRGHRNRLSTSKAPVVSHEGADSVSQATRSSRAGKSDVFDEYDMEEARRKAAATQLPPNSGIWETGERELFFHLSYRGFEPILPKHWMIDFPTLPLPVFAHQESDEPLIMCHRSTQFRGIRALRELLDTGTSIRDRTMSNQDLRTEPILEKAISKYITWALKDLGYPHRPSKTTIPVHTVATLLPGQSTHHVIRRLASEMHILATKHREAVNVQPSVEQLDSDILTPPNSRLGPTQIHPETSDDERALPVIYGVMIASSILAIFTLNSHTPFPPFLVRTLLHNRKSSLTPERAAAINPYLPAQLEDPSISDQMKTASNDEDSGVRFIASFDFSNASADVWNALVIAILAMQIRKTMGEVYDTWQIIRYEQDGQGSSTYDRATSASDTSLVEDSWLSNVDDTMHTTVPSPANGLVEQLLLSPSKPQKGGNIRGERRNTRGRNIDPDA